MTDPRRNLRPNRSTSPWAMTRADFWSLAGVAVILVVALAGGVRAFDAERLVEAARAAVEGQVGIESTRIAD